MLTVALLASCGAEHYVGSPYTGVKKPAPTPTATPVPVPTQTPTPRPQVWMPPLVLPFGYSFTPRQELPCGPTSGKTWNYICELTYGANLRMCMPLDPFCARFSGRRLTHAEAEGRRAWTKRCYDRYQVVIQQVSVAEGTATAGGDPCPEYPEFGIPQPNGTFVYVEAPTSGNSPCSVVPINALPVMFCSTHL